MNEFVMRILDFTAPDFDSELRRLLSRQVERDVQVEQTVRTIVDAVRARGDAALLDYTQEFDRLEVSRADALEVSAETIQGALDRITPNARTALEHAHVRVTAYHERQRQRSWDYVEPDGTRLGQRVSAIERVGLYVPGGKAAYPSSVLMNAVPAKVAGVSEIVMVVPTPDGETNDMVLAAAALAGIDRMFRIGGAQAIAALAFGTETVPRVDKIVGPGNVYVAMAKREVYGHVGVDMIAGPSEVVVVCDAKVDPDWAAMDLFAQAEHDELAQSILVTTEPSVISSVSEAIRRLLPTLERADIIRQSLVDHGALIRVPNLGAAANVINRIAPEHLELLLEQPQSLLDQVRHAGAIFVGLHSAEAMGDYCAGPNHVLPTSGTARFSSPLGVYDFQKRTSIIQCSPDGAEILGQTAAVLARAEKLTAHARSAEYRVPARKME